MININIDTSQIDKVVQKIDNVKSQIDYSVKNYLKLLMGSGAVSVQGVLQQKILELVYMRDTPDWYERTESLFDAVRASVEGNTIHLYMDDEWLADRPHVPQTSKWTGTELAQNRTEPYSIRVEEDYTYNNEYRKDYTRKGSHYMRETFHQLVQDIRSGDKSANKILEPIRRSWSR